MRTAITSAALVAGLLAAVAPASPAVSAAPPADGPSSSPVRLTLDSRPAGGGGTTYAITVHNTSGANAPHGLVTQLLPDALDYVSASPRASTSGRQVTWRLALPAGSSRVLTVTAAPDRTERDGPQSPYSPNSPDLRAENAAQDLRAPHRAAAGVEDENGAPASATTVCFQDGTRGEWLTCTGADDEWTPEPWVSANKVYAAASAAAALLVGTAGIVILRRRRSKDAEDDRTR